MAFLFCSVPHPSSLLHNGRARESWWQLAATVFWQPPPPCLLQMIHLDAVCKVEKAADSGADGF